MKAWMTRFLFGSLILTALAGKIAASYTAEINMPAAVVDVLARRGLNAQVQPPVPGSALAPVISFEAPGCKGGVRVLPIDLNLQVEPLFDAVVGPHRVRRFFYLDRSWSEADRVGLRLEWLKQKAISAWGLGRYAPNSTALLVAEPSHCHIAESIDWSSIWMRTQHQN